MLSNIINEQFIQLNVQAKNWEDAIRKCAEPLLVNGKVNAEYIDQMIENTKAMGAYIVITKHVALPHARPIEGSNKLAISISTLKESIEFGNQENDPVKYVFCLSAENSSTHLDMMSELVGLLENQTFFDVLDNSKSEKAVLDYIKLYEKQNGISCRE